MEKVLVSACLLGIPCRYDGKDKLIKKIKELNNKYILIPICPEQLSGLPTPREPCECKLVDNELKVFSKLGKDYTEQFYKGANIVLELCKLNDVKKVILCKNSPSCGIRTYDGTFTGTLSNYSGITAKILLDNGIEVISSEEFE